MDLTRLEEAVKRDATVNQSAITLLGNLSDELRKVANDPAAVNALADQLDANQKALADAVVANTPGAPGPSASTKR